MHAFPEWSRLQVGVYAENPGDSGRYRSDFSAPLVILNQGRASAQFLTTLDPYLSAGSGNFTQDLM